jgi:CRP-like cAMP-binding protein
MESRIREYKRVLSGCGPFEGLPDELLSSLLGRMAETSYGAGDKLICQDVRADSLQVLLDGRAAVVVVAGVGDPTEVGEVVRGDVVGEMALISGEPTSADVVARTAVRVLRLPAEDFHEMARHNPELAVVLTRLIAERLGRSGPDALGGKVVHGFRIVERLGRGGMAVVYEAEREEDGLRVALKMMSHRLTYDTTALARFREEAHLLDTFDHPNIARPIDRFSAYGTHFVALEFCDGPGLHEVASRRVSFVEDLVRPVIGQIATALEYVHGIGILHRDIKPSNAMLNHSGVVKLIDFGVARPIEPLDDRTQTLETSIVGTPFYMAPEQFEDATSIDARIDHYALACVTYELLAGERLFRKDTKFGIMRQKLELELPPAQEIGHGISQEMHAFLRANLDPDCARRSKSIAAQAAWAGPVDVKALIGSDA